MKIVACLALIAGVGCSLPAMAQSGLPTPVTPYVAQNSTLTTGGTAYIIVPADAVGCYVLNPLSATDQGIAAAEVVQINPRGTATTTGSADNATIQPGQTWGCIPGSKNAVSAIAATSLHKLSVSWWR